MLKLFKYSCSILQIVILMIDLFLYFSMLAKPQMPTDIQDPISPFQMCRMLLDQMGLLSWEKR